MKKFLLIAAVAILALALGANWYYTREVRQQLDRLSRTVSMFGELTYDSVRLSPAGEIHINRLAFRPRQADGEAVSVERVALDAGGLGGIASLQGRLQSGRLPPELGVRIEGLSVSFTALPATLPTGRADASAGLLFAAAGCGGRSGFDIDDLVGMDYFGWTADMAVHYRLVDRGQRLEVETRVRNRDAGAVSVDTTLDLMAGSMDAAAVMAAARQADLRAFSLTYEDLGFYDRMLTFCAGETGMAREAYIDHHVAAWRTRWAQLGAEPDDAVVAAYRDFLETSGRLGLRSRSEYSMPVIGIAEYSLPEFLGRMETMLAVNDAEPVPMALTPVDSQPAGAAAGPVAAADSAATDRAAEPGRAIAPRRSSTGAGPSWVDVEQSALAAHLDRQVRVETAQGRRYRGRLARVEADAIHIRIQGTGGYYVRPVERAGIRAVSVWLDAG